MPFSNKKLQSVPIPMQWIGPIKCKGQIVSDDVYVPLATFESPLWPSTQRGSIVCTKAGGIHVEIIDDRMTRSVCVEAQNGEKASHALFDLQKRKKEIAQIASQTSSHLQFLDMHVQQVGSLLFLRFEMLTHDAAGHNMVTKAADQILGWICNTYKELEYVSISGNYCTDKKVSSVNGILGRGKSVIADIVIPRTLVQRYLKSTPEKIVQLNIKKNLIGSTLSGSLRSSNAHFANMLLGIYLATGQDAANIVEGSQGISYAEMRGDDLYFSVNVFHVIVGTVGAGKDVDFVKENLKKMGCLEERAPGLNARRLAAIVGATVLCGELSLLAAQTNPGELMLAHTKLERKR